MYRHCMEKTNGLVTVKFNHRVINVGQHADHAWVEVEAGEGDAKEKKRFTADYVVGCDGATSAVRKRCSGANGQAKPLTAACSCRISGKTGFEKHGWDGGNYMIDPDFWGLIAKRGKNGLWRVTYGDKGGLTDDEYLTRRQVAFKKLLPGHPDPHEYRIEATSQFRIHNRCVEKMRVGRILLAADAAHACNPCGGYGCIIAVLDVGALADCLPGIYEGKAE
ncbi:hypothetical protein H2202_002008 [Exophiala xenobiotica]|nr:hypothetical protein H2202_002008 [Exophiala xenobiotica]